MCVGKSKEAGSASVLRHGAMPDTISFSPAQRDVTFDFTALHFTNSERNRYRYRLDGYDATWRDADFERSVSYTNLEHGTYTFRVKAANAHGVWSADEAQFTFTIERPFWITWWFYSLSGAIAAGESRTLRYRVSPRVRGDRTFGSMAALSRSPLGLLRRRVLAGAGESVRVHPDTSRWADPADRNLH